MRKISILTIFIVTTIHISIAQTSKENMFNNIYQTGAVYLVYPTEVAEATLPPKGYAPCYISHYGRHGSRYLIGDNEYSDIRNILVDANNNNALTPLGKDVLKRLNVICAETDGRSGDLSPLGVKQHRGIAERMLKNYSKLFSKNAYIDAKSTIVPRCILSMHAFCERLKELNPTLNIKCDASKRDMSYMSNFSPIAQEFSGTKGPWREEYRKFKNAHTNPDRLIASLFSDKTYIRKKINPDDVMWSLFWVASDMQNIEAKISLYDIFEKQELFDLWQCFNYRFYIMTGNSTYSNGLIINNAKPLLSNIVNCADSALVKGDIIANLRFGHDSNLIPLVSLMQIEGYGKSYEPSDELYKYWSDFKISPMGGNLQLIFYKNNSGDVIVKIMLNEHNVHIPVQTSQFPFYKWNDVKHFYTKILNAQ